MQRRGVTLQGASETIRALRGLRRLVAEHVAAEILEPATQPFVDDAKMLLEKSGSVMTGKLRDSIGAVVRIYPDRQWMQALIGPRSGFTWTDGRHVFNPTHYAHLIERGAKVHAIPHYRNAAKLSDIRKSKTESKHPGFAARPFMRPAWDRGAAGAMGEIREQMGTMVERLAAEVAEIPEQIRKNGTIVWETKST
jgi:hypothetical protein